TERSSVRGRVDSSRLGVMGHSMGGGGSLEAAKDRPSLQAAIPLTPWNLDKTWPEVRTPTLIFGADGDSIAPVRTHAEPLYQGLPSSLDRAYIELNNANHFTPNTSNTTIAKYSISWLKRFIDNDTRYEQFLCPLPRPSLTIEESRGNCPHTSWPPEPGSVPPGGGPRTRRAATGVVRAHRRGPPALGRCTLRFPGGAGEAAGHRADEPSTTPGRPSSGRTYACVRTRD